MVTALPATPPTGLVVVAEAGAQVATVGGAGLLSLGSGQRCGAHVLGIGGACVEVECSRVSLLLMITVLVGLKEIPPDHTGHHELATREVQESAATYEEALERIRAGMPEGWRINYIRVPDRITSG